jgi:hypothetical protein
MSGICTCIALPPGATSTSIGSSALTGRQRPGAEVADGGLELRVGRIARDRHDRRGRAARERVFDPVVRLHLLE